MEFLFSEHPKQGHPMDGKGATQTQELQGLGLRLSTWGLGFVLGRLRCRTLAF